MILLVVALTTGILMWYQKGYSWQNVWDLVFGSAVNSILAIIGLYCLKTIVWVIPVSALYLGAGFLFPVWPAIAITYIGLTLDLTLSFWVGKNIGKSHIMDEIKKRKAGKWVLDMMCENRNFVCFITRMLPGPPTEVTNMLFGALNMQYHKFLILSLLGLTPGMLPVIFMGKAATNPLSKAFILPLLVLLAIAVGSTLIYLLLLKKRNRQTLG